MHVDENARFACVRLTPDSTEAGKLERKIFEFFLRSDEAQQLGMDLGLLTTPAPPLGQISIGPHITIVDYNGEKDLCDWKKLAKLKGTAVKIDRLKPHDIIVTSKTRTASNMILVGVVSEDITKIRHKIGLKGYAVSFGPPTFYSPHVTVTVVPLDQKSYGIDPLTKRVKDVGSIHLDLQDNERAPS